MVCGTCSQKADGALQDVKWTLENRKSHLQLTKKTEIPNEIQAAIGLTFEQFCRTTLLAQGDFTKFLQSKESEKSDILEKLTGTEIYSQTGARIYAVTKEKRTDYENQNRKLEGIRLLTEKEIAEAGRAMAAQETEIKGLNIQKSMALQKRDWLRKNAELAIASENQKKVWEEKNVLLESDDFRLKEQLVNDWHTTTDARNWLVLLNKNRVELQKEEERSFELKTDFTRLCNGYARLKADTEKQHEELLRVEEYLQKYAPLLPMFEQSQSIIAGLLSVLSAQERADGYEKDISVLNKMQPLREEERAAKEKIFLLKSKENQQKQEEISRHKAKLDAMQLYALQEKRTSLEAGKEIFLKTKTALTLLKEKQWALKTAEEQEQSFDSRMTACQAQYNRLLTDLNHKKEVYGDIRKLYDKQKEAVEDWAKEARTRLAIGDTCPVCGQEIKSLRHDEDFQSILVPIRISLETKEKEYKEAEQTLGNNRTEFKTYEKETLRCRLVTEQARENYHRALKDAKDKCARCGIQDISDSTESALDTLIQNNSRSLEALNTKLNEAQALADVISGLQRQKDGLQMSVETARNELNAADKNLSELKNNIANKHSLIKNEKDTIHAAIQHITPLILWQEWQTEWNARPTFFIERLKQAAARYRQAQSKQAELKTAIALNNKEQESISTAKENICSAFPDWKDTAVEETGQAGNLEIAWNSLSVQAVRLKQSMLSIRNAIKELQNKLSEFYNIHPDFDEARLASLAAYSREQIEQLRTRLQQLKEEIASRRTAYRLTCEQAEAHLKLKPKMDEDDTSESLDIQILECEQQITERNQVIGQLQALLTQHEQNIALIKNEKKHADELRDIYLKWDRLCSHFGDEKGKNFRNIAQSFVLKELLNGANFYLQRLTDRYELECQAGSLTILLRDFYQGGVARPACTLSGGESFLVSLSLALGLSSLNRQSLSVDTLFIDEGFGTLSGDYLNTVMDTLEKLHRMGGKKVGIISHVEGLKERIKTQIQVKRIDNSRSEIRTVKMI